MYTSLRCLFLVSAFLFTVALSAPVKHRHSSLITTGRIDDTVAENSFFETCGHQVQIEWDWTSPTEYDLCTRPGTDEALQARATHKAQKAAQRSKSLAKKKRRQQRRSPVKPKITFGHEAAMNLDRLGFHGKDRRKIKKYHKKVVKKDMAKYGAATATIRNLAHVGGSDPHERLHITAAYRKPSIHGKEGEIIRSDYAVKETKKDGKKREGLFHVYPEDQNPRVPVPNLWAAAVAKAAPKAAAKAAAAMTAAEKGALKTSATKAAQKEKERKAEVKHSAHLEALEKKPFMYHPSVEAFQ